MYIKIYLENFQCINILVVVLSSSLLLVIIIIIWLKTVFLSIPLAILKLSL